MSKQKFSEQSSFESVRDSWPDRITGSSPALRRHEVKVLIKNAEGHGLQFMTVALADCQFSATAAVASSS